MNTSTPPRRQRIASSRAALNNRWELASLQSDRENARIALAGSLLEKVNGMTSETWAVNYDREFVAFDLETTGLSAENERIVEIGAVRFDRSGNELGRFQTLVNPCKPMPASAFSVHGISDAALADAPTCAEVLPGFLAFLGEARSTTLLAHNAKFDSSFLGRELGRIGSPSPPHAVADTLHLARIRLPNLGNHRLDTLARFLSLDLGEAHRALADCLRVKGVWLALDGVGMLENGLVAYPILDVNRAAHVPVGWDGMMEAIDRGSRVRIVYSGGSHGTAPRDITPRKFESKGGIAYLLAFCHKDAQEKRFRLDRLVRHEVLG